jgi:hypothetical protein
MAVVGERLFVPAPAAASAVEIGAEGSDGTGSGGIALVALAATDWRTEKHVAALTAKTKEID